MQDGIWYRYAVYFDIHADSTRLIYVAWPEAAGSPPKAAAWISETNRAIADDKVEIGLMASGVLMEVQGLKFVPLGADMPLPPQELVERKKQ